MKKFIFLILSLLFITGTSYSQKRADHHKEVREKIEQLEKIKLIETLKMDEQTTLKFFARRTELMDNLKNLINKENDLLDKLDESIKSSQNKDDAYYQSMIDQYLDLEQKINESKKSFITSLSDILSKEQIAKLLVFQKKFREEVRNILFKREDSPGPPEH
jgi:hypothetical protein